MRGIFFFLGGGGVGVGVLTVTSRTELMWQEKMGVSPPPWQHEYKHNRHLLNSTTPPSSKNKAKT